MIKMELLLDVLVVLVVVAWAGQEELVVEELRLVTGKIVFFLHITSSASVSIVVRDCVQIISGLTSFGIAMVARIMRPRQMRETKRMLRRTRRRSWTRSLEKSMMRIKLSWQQVLEE